MYGQKLQAKKLNASLGTRTSFWKS